ncbi:hypothetical protein NE237_027347 [Protea cynaroides]|uniref:Ferrochelatase n=1 Tax=Protea cynaroides TaxID=273540 RepID=A0A9Q0GQB7_9MAGN|nr:hypothetical protein NE237_027347 [Protea cynaroides]
MASLIGKELQNFSSPEEVMLFFSAHGVLVSYVKDARDPYKDQIEDSIFLIMQELKARGINNENILAYQEYKHLALESGIENWGRVPALDCTSSFISDVADGVIEALPSATAMSTTEVKPKEAETDPLCKRAHGDYKRLIWSTSTWL